MYQQQNQFSPEQVVQMINYYQQEIMKIPYMPRTPQEAALRDKLKMELDHWIGIYNSGMAHNRPMMETPTMAPTMPVSYHSPYQPQQSHPQPMDVNGFYHTGQMQPTTTISNSNNITGRYSNRQPKTQPQQQQPVMTPQVHVVTNGQSKPVEPVKPKIEIYLPDIFSVIEQEITLSSPESNKLKTMDEYREMLDNFVSKRKAPPTHDLMVKELDKLLTGIFNALAKNYVTKTIVVDSLLGDYADIISYRDKMVLVKDQKELDNILDYLFQIIDNIEIATVNEDSIKFKIKLMHILINDNDSFKDIKKNLLGNEYLHLQDTVRDKIIQDQDSKKLQLYIMKVSNGIFHNTYYVVNSSKGMTLYSV